MAGRSDEAELGDEPRDKHSLSCPIWQSDDPDDECDCFDGGVHRLIERFEAHGPRASLTKKG